MFHSTTNAQQIVNYQCIVPSFSSCLPLVVQRKLPELQLEILSTSMSNEHDAIGSDLKVCNSAGQTVASVDHSTVVTLGPLAAIRRVSDGARVKAAESDSRNHTLQETRKPLEHWQQMTPRVKSRSVGYSKRRRSSVDLQDPHSGLQRQFMRSTRSSSPSPADSVEARDRSVPSVGDSASAQSSPEEFMISDAHLKSRSLDIQLGLQVHHHHSDDTLSRIPIGNETSTPAEAARQDTPVAMLEEEELPRTAARRRGCDSDEDDLVAYLSARRHRGLLLVEDVEAQLQRGGADDVSLECQLEGGMYERQPSGHHCEEPSVQQQFSMLPRPGSDDDVTVRDVPDREDDSEGNWDIRVDVTLAHVKGQKWGSCDVIGSMDVDSSGEFLATGGIARKVRIYSLTSLRAGADSEADESVDSDSELDLKTENCFSQRRDHSASACDLVGGQGFIPRSDGSGMKRKATSTSDLLRLDEEAAKERSLAGGLVLDPNESCMKMLCCAAKLSSVQWVPPHLCSTPSRVACGDYDGVFAEWDLNSGLCVLERDEHGGKRIWSTDFSMAHPLAASAGDDGCVRLWSGNSEDSVAVVKSSGGGKKGAVAICSVKFGPQGSPGEHLLAFAGSDARVHLYDVRQLSTPLTSFRGHQRTVSFVRFLDASTLVTSSIDSTVRVWDISGSTGRASSTLSEHADSFVGSSPIDTPPLLATCTGHVNRRNFVGLSVRHVPGKGAVIVTGSEINELAMYRLNQHHSVLSNWMVDFTSGQAQAAAEWRLGEGRGVDEKIRMPFVSSVCWNEGQDSLVAANSDGTVRIMSARAV